MYKHAPRFALVALPFATVAAEPSPAHGEKAPFEGRELSGQRSRPDGTIQFRRDSTEITTDSARQLDRIAEFLKSHTDGEVLVAGHPDRPGRAPTHRVLSARRAQRVRDELIRRDIRPAQISVLNATAPEPPSHETAELADPRSRRVEVWVGTREAIAVVHWIYRTVQTQRPAATRWDSAYLRMELRRFFRVRTAGQSAGELVFPEGHRLYLGPESSLVVYGRDARPPPDRPSAADVTLDEGTLLASLASRGLRRIAIETDAARMRLSRTRKTRIDSSKSKARSTVSVYDGRADISAGGRSVRVTEGYGTRVKNGLPPEPPSRLPPPPRWLGTRPATVFSGLPSPTVRWRTLTSTTRALLEVGGYDDRKVRRPVRTVRVVARSVPSLDLAPGRYWLRVTSVSERDLVGFPSLVRELRVLPAPEPLEGPSIELDGDHVVMTHPGIVGFPAPAGTRTEWMLDGDPVQREAYLGPGEHTLSCKTTDAKGRITKGRIRIRVERLTLDVEKIGAPTLDGIDSVTPVALRVMDYRGRPVDGLDLVATTPELLGARPDDGSSGPGPMNPVAPPITATARAKATGPGSYRLRHRDYAAPTAPRAVMVIYEGRSRTGRVLEVPIAVTGRAARPEGDPNRAPPPRLGFSAGVMGGMMRGIGGDFGPGVRGEATFVIAQGLLRLSLGAETGFTRLRTYNDVGTLSLFPLNAKATFALRVDPVRPYVGLAGGLRIQNLSRNRGAAETVKAHAVSENLMGIIGVGLYGWRFEGFIEGRYGKVNVRGEEIRQIANGPTLYFGLRYFSEEG